MHSRDLDQKGFEAVFSGYSWDFSYSPQRHWSLSAHHWSLSASTVRHWSLTLRPHTLARGLKGFCGFCADSVWLRLPRLALSPAS